MADLEYLKKSPWQKFTFNFVNYFKNLPERLVAFFKKFPLFFKGLFATVASIFIFLGEAMKKGDWKTRTTFGVMGFGQMARKQILRGILFLVFQVIFILYMVFFGVKYLAKFGTLGEVAGAEMWDEELGIYVYTYVDNSLLILLYSIITLFIMIAFVYAWYQSIKVSYAAQMVEEAGRKLANAGEDVETLINEQYHTTLLAIPMGGIFFFTILPIIFMVFIAFTNYDLDHSPPKELFTWTGFNSFIQIFGGGMGTNSKFGFTFASVLLWTLIWAFFATFTSYFLGMIVSLMINKKGIKFKKLWRTILIITVAVPQFVSLMLMSQMLSENGIVNKLFLKWGVIKEALPFFTNTTWARATIIIVNIWVGIPFTMLMCTGILMNIPEDLYESARIDGAGPVKAYMQITLPYMIHVTTPYLVSAFVANINNFNVIFLLSGGDPSSLDYQNAGTTDLLVTWLYKLTYSNGNYTMASVIGILTFVIISTFSMIVYTRSNAVKNEEELM